MRTKARILFWIGLLCFLSFFFPTIQHNNILNGTENKLTLGLPFSPWLVSSWTEIKKEEIKNDSKDPKMFSFSSSSSSQSAHYFQIEFITWSWLIAIFGVIAMVVSRRLKSMAKLMKHTALAMFIVIGLAHAGEPPTPKLDLHVVPTPIKSYRLLGMNMDDEGFIWAGAIHQVVHRYDPRTGNVEDFPVPFQATAAACICVGKKVYILGQSYPKLIIYDRTMKKFSEVAYPSSKPDVWSSTEASDARHLYLFDRGSAGVIKWDTQTDVGQAIPWPYKAPFPCYGHYESRDKAIWCNVWDLGGGQYQPLGIARLNVARNEFTGFFAFPKEDDGLKPFTDPDTTIFLPYTLKGKVVPFDFKEKRWCKFLNVPQYGKLFGFMGGPNLHNGRQYFSLSTYNGTDTGCDGQPYHFCNAILEFDPYTRRFDFLKLEAKDAYYQVAYQLSAKAEFFATGSNIREKDGKLNRDRAGEVVFWQTVRPR